MSTVTITISRRTHVDHNDQDAAGFARGFWWSVPSPHHDEPVVSACATYDEAVAVATELAESAWLGCTVVVKDETLPPTP